MTSSPTARCSDVVRALFVIAVALVVSACSARTEGLDARKLPEDVRADYDVFARRCSKCHSLARPLTSGITDDQQWVMYVNRMRRQPGSGISYADQDRILRFLRYYAAELRQKEAERRGGSAPSAPTDVVPDASAPPSDAAPEPAIEKGDGG